MPDRVLDTSSLSAIFGDDEQTIKELLEEFIVSSEKTMTDLSAAVDQESAAQVKSLAHKLKSSARTVGAHVLADLCEALEAAGKEKNWIKINEAGPAALIAFSHIRDRIQTGQ